MITFPRDLTRALASALGSLPVVVLTGMRQTGKTTLLCEDPAFASRKYFTLDDHATLESARLRPSSLVEAGDAITIDEAQRCPELLLAVKAAVDRDRRPGRIVLSGSANFALLKGVADSLAGRAVYFELQPFTRRELLRGTASVPHLARWLAGAEPSVGATGGAIAESEILTGGLPVPALNQVADAALWFRGFEQTYVERDVLQLARVDDPIAFRNLLRLALLRTGNLLNVSSLARDARLNTITAARYLGLLEASFLVRRIPPLLASRTTRLVKSPKLYATDSGLTAHVAGASDLSQSEPLRGALLETYVAQNLAGLLAAHVPDAEIAFWAQQGRHEVDFVLTHRRRRIGIEVKAASRFGGADLHSLQAWLASATADGRDDRIGILAYQGERVVAVGERLFAVPIGHLLE